MFTLSAWLHRHLRAQPLQHGGRHQRLHVATQLFDEVIVAVAVGHHKKTMFSLDDRMALVREVVKPWPQVRVESFDGLVRDFVRAHGARAMVRGVRSVTDFDYERQLAGMNRHLMPDVETVFLTPSDQFAHLSSSFVREIHTLGGDVQALVSPAVLQRLRAQVPVQPR